uniref:Uncharacterized protein n=1 Tax=Anopheles arabiensis TaxID=7173 RepID=A0A182IHB7_ANOAR
MPDFKKMIKLFILPTCDLLVLCKYNKRRTNSYIFNYTYFNISSPLYN